MFTYVLVDSFGFIGAFSSIEKAQSIIKDYPNAKLILKKYELNKDLPTNTVWFLPYKNLDQPITVTNDVAFLAQLQYQYLRLDLTYKDNLEFFKRDMDKVHLYEFSRLSQDDEDATPANTNEEFILVPESIEHLDSKSITELMSLLNATIGPKDKHTPNVNTEESCKHTQPLSPLPSVHNNDTSGVENENLGSNHTLPESPPLVPKLPDDCACLVGRETPLFEDPSSDDNTSLPASL